ncbi:MAG: glycoside hydrolase family 1 protein [Candidatus Lokiarchaeota archaeon]|nr:glycoside hydrolase family 1 protein [Candidatus Lokiarchaeota archaeon]
MVKNGIRFPDSFLFGAATSSYQIEGNIDNSDWWEFEQIPGKIQNNQKAGFATNHWNLYEEDFSLIKKMNCDIYRMSVEWSRIIPKEGEIDFEAIKHYHKMFDWLNRNNIKIMLTIFHFTLPLWFSKKGGLENKKNLIYFEKFVDLLAKEFKDKIDYWCTINEPLILALLGYGLGKMPPSKKDSQITQKVVNNLLRMHASAYNILKNNYNIKFIGIVKVIEDIEVLSNQIEDHEKASQREEFMNNSFFNSIKTGKLPYRSEKEEVPNLKDSFDFLGLNYYHRIYFSSEDFPKGESPSLPNIKNEYLYTDLGWQPFPSGIFNILEKASKFTDKPLIITENGIATENDEWRQYYIISHLLEVYRAIQNKINVKGYIYWSLLDNFEWTYGFNPRFGLIHVDYNTFKRTLKKSGKLYGEICKFKSIQFKDIKRLENLFPDIHEKMKMRNDFIL